MWDTTITKAYVVQRQAGQRTFVRELLTNATPGLLAETIVYSRLASNSETAFCPRERPIFLQLAPGSGIWTTSE